MLKSRLRCVHSHFDGTCNPEGPDHWFKKFIDSDANIYKQHYVIDDNPNLPQDFVRDLKKEYEGTVYYERYILGKWALAEGLIFPMYQQAIGEIPDDAEIDNNAISIDYGTENAFAAILWRHNYKDKVWYATKEYYHSGRDTGIQKTDEEYADDMETFAGDIIQQNESAFENNLDNPFNARKKITVVVDPSAASFIVALKKRGVFKVRKADNAVLDGIRETAVAMRKGLIKIDPGMKNTIDELQGYAWDEKSGEDRPIKEKDHACIAGDTLIDTDEGQIPIKKLVGREGKVWCYNTKTDRAELRHYKNVMQTGQQEEIYEITLQDGSTVKATGNHPVLTKRGWIRVDALTSKDFIVKIGG